MILSEQEITSRSTGGNDLISLFTPGNVRRSSYDLTVGEEFYCGQSDSKRSNILDIQTLNQNSTFSIPANGICFVLCAEKINLPLNITARVALRMPFIYRGLVLTAQPPFDPGYNGKVVVMLHNLSSQEIQLTQGERLASIEFSQVSHPTQQTTSHNPVSSLIGTIRFPLSGSLTEMERKVEKAASRVTLLLGQMGSIIALIITIAGLSGFASYNTLSDRLSDSKSLIEKLEEASDKQQKQIEDLMRTLAEHQRTHGKAQSGEISSAASSEKAAK